MANSKFRLLGRGSWGETSRIADILRRETIGGALLIIAAVAAVIAANVGDGYATLRDTVIGPSSLHLDLTVGAWAADGLLAIFFFVAGLELKREFVAGDLRDPRRAAIPVLAAVGGMIVPALLFLAINAGGSLRGWAIPTATDIAFALAILAVISSHLPTALRTFLLTLAIVDDLLAITIIALFYSDDLDVLWLLAALVPLGLFTLLVQRRIRSWWLLLPLAAATWGLVHASGVHATVAGVLLGFAVPVLRRDGNEGPGLAEQFEHLVRPVSAGVAVPVFAFFSAGVAIGGLDGLRSAASDPITIGVVVGLCLGKPIGVLGATWLASRFTRADLDESLEWIDVTGLSLLAGIGFTVSLLIGELAYGAGSVADEHVKIGVLAGSILSALLAAVVLRTRNRHYRLIAEAEQRDDDGDGIPDVYQD
ncbi:Na+/H+ antiporter NhaA [Aeromicrobium wangtongii]|uniref:Na(+)/H(+) antiporter NhaA n=1 Tax=Aeromicrobium wangtongii TaxID=2969247 RepID=A0ABY5M826_9ACTN|nr:Na+/H+ antiporter NhaA [Aeromicrobium wangtongii]MCD9198866.1 Na+/H+ antiporter NhaA [Aeromicrobium wangtongii]UUP13094.1 Na+/H+ antiporter NhaA [Aeromicrobium wangtongii]